MSTIYVIVDGGWEHVIANSESALGVRILITLDPSARISAESVGTKVIKDPSYNSDNSWTYNVWKLKSN